jgi:hypothetical protein
MTRRNALRRARQATLGGASTVALCAVMSACGAAERQHWDDTFTGDGDDAFLVDDDFVCLDDARFTDVGGRRIWNVFGGQAQEQAEGLARSGTPGTYPVGTVVQLFPSEAMVKRGQGFSPATNDWEYLLLDTSSGQTVITARGTTDVRNAAGTCLSCHGAATAFDNVCFTNSSCKPLPSFIDTHVVPARDDARCQ